MPSRYEYFQVPVGGVGSEGVSSQEPARQNSGYEEVRTTTIAPEEFGPPPPPVPERLTPAEREARMAAEKYAEANSNFFDFVSASPLFSANIIKNLDLEEGKTSDVGAFTIKNEGRKEVGGEKSNVFSIYKAGEPDNYGNRIELIDPESFNRSIRVTKSHKYDPDFETVSEDFKSHVEELQAKSALVKMAQEIYEGIDVGQDPISFKNPKGAEVFSAAIQSDEGNDRFNFRIADNSGNSWIVEGVDTSQSTLAGPPISGEKLDAMKLAWSQVNAKQEPVLQGADNVSEDRDNISLGSASLGSASSDSSGKGQASTFSAAKTQYELASPGTGDQSQAKNPRQGPVANYELASPMQPGSSPKVNEERVTNVKSGLSATEAKESQKR